MSNEPLKVACPKCGSQAIKPATGQDPGVADQLTCAACGFTANNLDFASKADALRLGAKTLHDVFRNFPGFKKK
jgi:ribosomal protein L37E